MGWIEKARPVNFETSPLTGLMFLDGDLVARAFLGASRDVDAPIFKAVPVQGMKYPRIQFPSGMMVDIVESDSAEHPTIHLFGEMSLSFGATYDEILRQAKVTAAQVGYRVTEEPGQGIRIDGDYHDDAVILLFDATTRRLSDIQPAPPEPHALSTPLDDETRKQLPKLYSQESRGMDALAHVKFVLPGSEWTWYATEFDGEDVCFGLVSGWEIELGYFSLSELHDVRTRAGARVVRDWTFSPMTLKELKSHHERLRWE